MPTSRHAPRLTRIAILAVTATTALSIAACGSSNTSSPPSPSTATSTVTSTTTSPAPAPQGEAKVSGLIASVAGNSIQVTKEDNSNAAVNFTSTTNVTEVTPATLTDVAQGSCVTVRPTQDIQSGQPATAASVRVSPSVNGTCPPAKGAGQNSTTTPPPPPGSPSPAPPKPKPLRGSVASVTGNTITVAGTDPSGNTTQTPVTVDDQTHYSKMATATADAIAAGKCLTARGTMDNGALQATSINVRPSKDGTCAGKPPHGQ